MLHPAIRITSMFIRLLLFFYLGCNYYFELPNSSNNCCKILQFGIVILTFGDDDNFQTSLSLITQQLPLDLLPKLQKTEAMS